MKKIVVLIVFLGAFFGNVLFSQISYSYITSEEEFFSVPVENRSFHVLMREAGLNRKELFIGDGDFAIPAPDPNNQADFDWVVNTDYPFSLVYDETGNLTFTIGSVVLVDQPLQAIKKIYLGNRNTSGLSFQGIELKNVSINSFFLPDLITFGPHELKGLKISDFTSNWQIVGNISFVSNFSEPLLAHNSSVYIYGEVPELSIFSLISGLFSVVFVLIYRNKKNRKSIF